MTLYIRPSGEKVVDPGQLPASEVRKLRRASRGARRGHGPLSATESPDPDVPRGTDTPDAA